MTETLSAVTKLATSGISDLVRDGRGYKILSAASETEAASLAKQLGANLRRAQGKRLRNALLGNEVLVMPWFLAGDASQPSATQFRCSDPEVDGDGRALKYEFVEGSHVPLGQHPWMPVEWLADASVPLLLAEGLLKADSALTAWLAAENAARPEQVRDEARVAILSFAGIGNWGDNPEWAQIALRGRQVWIGFDADVTSNPQVRRMANRLWGFLTRRGASPKLLDIAQVASSSKDGIDDYLGKGGTWQGLLSCLVDHLPPMSDTDTAPGADMGTYRISVDGTRLEHWVETRDSSGQVIGSAWRDNWPGGMAGPQCLPLGGQVVALRTTRSPSDTEDATGVFDDAQLADEDCVKDASIEVCWRDDDNQIRRATVTGDEAILSVVPDRWSTLASLRVQVPSALRLHPAWPPSGSLGAAWLQAVKANSADVASSTVWTRDGWVPQQHDPVPAFIVGAQTIGDPTGATVSGTRKIIQRWESYGAGPDDPRDIDDPAYRGQILADLRRVCEVFSHAFTSPGTFSSVLLAALRPAVPLRPRTSVFTLGPTGAGKTFTAAALMSFWARRPGAFRKDSLPGSAQDSVAFTESLIAAAVIHVADDLAPSSSGRKAEQEQAAIESLLRNVFNGVGRGRANPDGTARRAKVPHALLVATAENDLFAESIRNRVLTVSMDRGALPKDRGPTDALDALCHADGAPARVAQAAVKLLRHAASKDNPGWFGQDICGWAQLVRFFEQERSNEVVWVTEMLNDKGFAPAQTTRASEVLSDILVVAALLRALLVWTGADVREWDLARPAGFPDVWKLHIEDHAGLGPVGAAREAFVAGVGREVVRSILSEQAERARMTPPRAFLAAVASLLSSGKAHLVTRGDVMRPPGKTESDSVGYGWGPDQDKMRPRGDSIGFWGLATDGAEIVCLSIRAAFSLARRLCPDLIPPGSGQSQLSAGLRAENLVWDQTVFSSDKNASGRVTIGGETTHGIAILAETLFGGDDAGS